jgi:WD40 repeat protein
LGRFGRRLAAHYVGRIGLGDRTIRTLGGDHGAAHSEPPQGHSGWVSFSPDSKLVASGSDDMRVRLWEASTGRPHGEPLEGRSNWVMSVAFSPDGKLVTVSNWVTKDVLVVAETTG